MIIAQFETDPTLIQISEKHHAWHAGGAHGFPGRTHPMGSVGSGQEFFQFHHDLMNEFFAWNNVHRAVADADLAAWHAVPPELKVPQTGWPNPWPGLDLAAAEARIVSNSPAFVNADALGIFVEGTVHNWIHGAVAAAPAFHLSPEEQNIIAGFHSVQSTWFYRIHGLVDYWWNRYLHPKNVLKEHLDGPPKHFSTEGKHHLKEVIDVPPKNFLTEGKNQIKDVIDSIPHKHVFEGLGKLVAEGPDSTFPGVDPAVVEELKQRIAVLEGQVKVKKSPFIKPFMRPEVGREILNADIKTSE